MRQPQTVTRVVGEASTSREAVEMVSNTHPDVVVLDMVFPNDASGIALAHRLLKRNPSLRILFLSMVKDESQVADALETGALGYVTWTYVLARTPASTAATLLYAVPVQLLAYHTAAFMGTDVDQPRNLAKSVTVE